MKVYEFDRFRAREERIVLDALNRGKPFIVVFIPPKSPPNPSEKEQHNGK
jgi:hypothetical protein